MPPSDPTASETRRDTLRAFSIMFFAVALLWTMLGWAQGVRHDTKVLGIPETGAWLIAAAVFVAVGVLFLLWSRRSRPG